MALLEDLRPGTHVKGLLPGRLVTLIEVKRYGASVVEVTYKDARGSTGSILLYQDNAARLEIASEDLPWSFDADGAHHLSRLGPNPRNPNKGLTENHIKLGCVQPGESVSTFGDALRRLSDQSTHLYLDGQRYWYDTQQSVARLAQDRVAQYDDDTLYDEIERRLRAEQAERGDFSRVHICPTSSAEVSDDDTAVRLVILKPHYTHGLRDQQSKARAAAREMLDMRGNTRRAYRNTLVFLAADRARLEDLKQGVRSSWPGIPSNRASPAKT